MSAIGLALTLRDAAALADAWGAGTRIALGGEVRDADILAPSGFVLNEEEVARAVRLGAAGFVLSCGNQMAPPDLAVLARLFEAAIHGSGAGCVAACLAAPALGRTVYQGYWFQDGRLLANLHHAFAALMAGRVLLVREDVVSAGPAAIRRALAGAREQGAALVLVDAIDPAQCGAVAQALAGQLMIAGPAWLAGNRGDDRFTTQPGRTAILSGALDRQTLFQLGAARESIPFWQMGFSRPDPAADAMAWAAGQSAMEIIIASSAPPDQLAPGVNAAGVLGNIAAGLAASGIRNFVIAGNDTGAAILSRLGVPTLTAGAAQHGLRWLHSGDTNFLLKPGGFGDKNLFLNQIGPQLRLNAAAE